MTKKKSGSQFLDKLLLKWGMPIVALIIKVWMLSCRVVACKGAMAEAERVEKKYGSVYSVWHQRMFFFFHFLGYKHLTVMISQSKDGDYANAVGKQLGFQTVRGSNTRGGKAALIALIRKLKNNSTESAAMLVDGPTGPPRQVKIGVISIAKKTGKPIIPLAYGARNKWVARSWDRYILPIPFSKIVVWYGPPVYVPANATQNEVETIRRRLESEMNTIADLCDSYWDGASVGKPGFDLPAHPKP